ncbi:MAG: alpha/beta hydrolase [Rhodobacteraceae bacterium]|nr:alpha/beta hydrolase [Paracoccaceae bacterium]
MRKLKLILALLLVKSPEWLVGLILTGRRKRVSGRVIDAKAQAVGELLNLVRETGGPPTLEESRAGLAALAAKFDLPGPQMLRKSDILMPGANGPRPARLYDAVSVGDETPRATLLYLHGGGWVQGGLDTHDGLCAKLAAWAGIRVISYDYRLAPEHKFPAGLDDCLACYRAMVATPSEWGVDAGRIVVGGDSAGANLAAAMIHDLQGQEGQGAQMPAGQVLIYPAVDTGMDSDSMRALKDAYVLPVERINWYLDLYLPDGQDRLDPRVAPLFSDRLAGQPAALIIVAGHDPLWDDGQNYATALRQVGVAVELVEFPGQVHAFVSITRVIPQGDQALRQVANWLRNTIG